MTQVECLAGAATTQVGDDIYHFERDGYGRFVAEVEKLNHIAILTGLPYYRRVTADPVSASSAGPPEREQSPPSDPAQSQPPDLAKQDGEPGDPADGDLTRIAGIGEATAAKLGAAGIDSISKLAALSEEQASALDAELKLNGLIARSQWVEQAREMIEAQKEA